MFLRLAALSLVPALTLTACNRTVAEEPTNAAVILVSSTETECLFSAQSATAGEVTFEISNDGGSDSKFRLVDESGKQLIEGEIPAGATDSFSATLTSGTYDASCLPEGGEELTEPFVAI